MSAPEEARTAGPAAAETRIETWCEGLIEAAWLAALAAAPLLVNAYTHRSFDPDKAAAVKTLALVTLAAWLVKAAAGGRLVAPPAAAGGAAVPAGVWRWGVLAPAILFAACLAASSALSVAPELSWDGSYPRAQGAWTRLAYMAIFVAILAHLRRPAQLERLTFVVVLSGLAAALYAAVQHLGRDPILWADRHDRVGSTLGNPIFFGAFLLMTLFVATAVLAGRSSAAEHRRDAPFGARLPAMLGAGVLLYAVLLELVTLAISQSRGPVLGLLAGSIVFALGALARRRRPLRRRTTAAAAVALAALAWVASETPFAGRLAALTDPTTGTSRVRLAIWRGTSQLLSSNRPLTPPGGEPDRLAALRPWIGHGPETFMLAFPRYHPPELTRLEKPGSAPDRAHNAVLDLLVTLGAAGLLAWLWLWGGLCRLALVALGLAPAGSRTPALALASGAALGAAAPWLATGEPAWSGLGLAAGALLGLAAALAAALVRGGMRGAVDGGTGRLILALLATLVAHFVEIQFSFAVTATELYFWALAALLVVAGEGWLRPAAGGALRDPRSGGLLAGCRAGLAAAPVFGCLGFLFVAGLHASAGGAGVLPPAPARAAAVGVAGLFVFTGLGAVALAPRLRAAGWAAFAAAGLGPAALLAAAHLGRLLALPGLAAGGWDLFRLSVEVSSYASGFFWWLLAAAVAAGLAFGAATGDRRRWARRPALAAAAAMAAAITVPWLADRTQLSPLRADVMVKHGAALLDAGRPEGALALLSEACRLAPREPQIFLMAGKTALAAARAAAGEEEKDSYLALAATHLARARELAPLDPDHTVNLARILIALADLAPDSAGRADLHRRAAEEYRHALRLRPCSAPLRAEATALAERAGDGRRALELPERRAGLAPTRRKE